MQSPEPENQDKFTRIEAAVEKARAHGSWYGTWTLFKREMMRFLSIAGHSIVSPVISTLLYFLVFGYTIGQRIDEVMGIPYVDFIVPGLVMMTLILNTYFNTSFSFFLGKIHGTIVDLLASPIGPVQILLAYVIAAMIRGVITGGIVWVISGAMGANTLHKPLITILFMTGASFLFALVGLVNAILAKEFEHINFLPSFVLTPLSFLGGVFYSISMLSEPWQTVSKFNPILYINNGIRYGMTGITDVSLFHGALFIIIPGTILMAYTLYLLKTGKRLRE